MVEAKLVSKETSHTMETTLYIRVSGFSAVPDENKISN